MANKTFIEVIQQLIKVNDDLINKKIDLDTAKQIAQNTQVVINAAKVHIEFLKISKGQDEDSFFKNNLLKSPDEKKPYIVDKDINNKHDNKIEEENIDSNKKDKNHEKNYAENSSKSCDKCINYDICLINPKCPMDKYDYFVKKK